MMITSAERLLWRQTAGYFNRLRASQFWHSDSLQGLLSLVDQGIVSGTSFTTSVIIARCGTSETLGAYFLAWNLVTILQAVQGDLLSAPYTVFSRRRSGDAVAVYTASSLVHQLILAIGSTAVVAFILSLLAHNSGPRLHALRDAGIAFVAAMPFILTRQFHRDLGFARLQIGLTTFVDGCVSAFQLTGLLTLGALHRLDVSSAYLVLGVACGIPTLARFCNQRERLHFNTRLLLEHWRENWSFGRWALAGQVTGRATGYLLPWTLAWFHGEATTGILAACMTLVNMGGTFITGVSNYLTPKAVTAFASGGVDALCAVLRKVAAVYLCVIGTFFIVLTLFGGQLANLVYGPRYAGVETVMALLAFSLLLSSMNIIAGNGLWAMHQPQANFRADFCAMTVGLLVLSLSVREWGATGAALSLCAGNATGLCIRWRIFSSVMERECAARTRE